MAIRPELAIDYLNDVYTLFGNTNSGSPARLRKLIEKIHTLPIAEGTRRGRSYPVRDDSQATAAKEMAKYMKTLESTKGLKSSIRDYIPASGNYYNAQTMNENRMQVLIKDILGCN